MYSDLSGKIKCIQNNFHGKIFSNLIGGEKVLKQKWKSIYKEQDNKLKERLLFKSISKHAMCRIKERFQYRGYGVKTIKDDIMNYDSRRKQKDETIIVNGKIGTYIIGKNGTLITVF